MKEYLARFVVRPSTAALCRKWAEVSDQADRKGRPIACADAWHAATALVVEAPLVTHNARDFLSIEGLRVISEST